MINFWGAGKVTDQIQSFMLMKDSPITQLKYNFSKRGKRGRCDSGGKQWNKEWRYAKETRKRCGVGIIVRRPGVFHISIILHT